jgi:hypothetical protein
MPHSDRLLRARRALLLLGPAALLNAQLRDPPHGAEETERETGRLPNGKDQKNEIAKADYENNLKDARELMDLAKSFEEDLEKDDRFVLSITSLKKLDDIEKLTKRIRGRLKRV